jgi:catechol 2,3-dioxygenase-like lactoylglutathione lyase family enzyme
MYFRTSNCVALGVPDRAEAVRLYTETLGFKLTKTHADWSEVQSGALTLYLVEDNVATPCFDLVVEDVDAARDYLASVGFTQVDLSPGETFMKDPFGYHFCLSPERTLG